MEILFDRKIEDLANLLNKPLYAVGGCVRNFLINKSFSTDIDLAGSIPVSELSEIAEKIGFSIVAVYKRTGTVVISDGKNKYEYTRFRSEKYADGGCHTPISTEFTDDLVTDAKRRDFKCNAVYYDIKDKKIVDPLGGVRDIENKVLDCVTDADEVFRHDGLRLMRLARFCGELGFTPSNDTLLSARKNACNIKDISAERIYDELKKILRSDGKYEFSDKRGHYKGLKLLSETGVLDYIMPELTLGRNMPQRSDFHDYDVLEHSLRCALYADKSVRLDALLHDVGKPYCMETFGKYYDHPFEGEIIARRILRRIRADNETVSRVCFTVKNHMLDLNCDMRETKIRRFIVDNYSYISPLLKVKQADFTACKDDLSKAPSVAKWENIIEKMKKDGTPFTVKDLKITADDLITLGFEGKAIGDVFHKLFDTAVLNPEFNERETLLKIAAHSI